jgi:magnesium-transporting ATPase (P-type)
MKLYNFTLILILLLNTIFIINYFKFPNYSYILWFILFIAGLVFSIKSLEKYRSKKKRIFLSVISIIVNVISIGLCSLAIFAEYMMGPPA